MTASGYAYSNMLPRTNLEVLKTKIPEATWQTLVRARGAHLNAFEGFPFFAGAMVSSLPCPKGQTSVCCTITDFCS